MSEYGSCIVCGRKVKNKVYRRGMVIHICPKHLKGKNKKEVSEYLDSLIKNRSKKARQYDDMMKSILIIEAKITTLSDKVKAWMDVIEQRRLEEYKISKDIMRISGKIDKLTKAVDGINRVLKTIQCNSKNAVNYDELCFLNSLLRESDVVHYKVEDGVIIVYLEKNLELIIYDHPLTRDVKFRERAGEIYEYAEKYGVRILDAANYLNLKSAYEIAVEKNIKNKSNYIPY